MWAGSDRRGRHDPVVAKVGRNEPCPCGSGRKAKRCCGVERGPSEESLARAFLAHACREAARKLRHLSDVELGELFEELWDLPKADLSLQVELPKLHSPVLNRLCDAVADEDPDPELLEAVVGTIDTPVERARIAGAAIARAEAGTIDEKLASAALLDLGSGSRRLLRAGLLQAVAVRVGVARTPGGVLLAA
jgi:SEC-C motif